jgi:hypothetical protein
MSMAKEQRKDSNCVPCTCSHQCPQELFTMLTCAFAHQNLDSAWTLYRQSLINVSLCNNDCCPSTCKHHELHVGLHACDLQFKLKRFKSGTIVDPARSSKRPRWRFTRESRLPVRWIACRRCACTIAVLSKSLIGITVCKLARFE